jgi:transposase, IS6 family
LRWLIPSAWHHLEQYANCAIEADHSRLNHQLRPMHGLRTDRTVQAVIAGHAFLQNRRPGHYKLGLGPSRLPSGWPPPAQRMATAFSTRQG